MRRGLLLMLLLGCCLSGQAQSYIGFVYPAGGQRGTRVVCTFGGQALDGLQGVTISGTGVTGRILEYNRRMNPQMIQLLREQLRELRAMPPEEGSTITTNMMRRINKIIDNYVSQPQCSSIANLVVVEFTIAADAPCGQREVRLYTQRSVSNPLPFDIGDLPEVGAEPMGTTPKPILGKEAQSLPQPPPDKQPPLFRQHVPHLTARMAGDGAHSQLDDDEIRVTLPVVVNGQIAPGSVDRYRFTARAGQKLVLNARARTLIPYLADAVPGWFQPVMVLCAADGREVAYNDDHLFDPDPRISYSVPADGEYVVALHDALYRGREDFVYRITITEAALEPPTPAPDPARIGSDWPLLAETEPNDTLAQAQAVSLPALVQGAIQRVADHDYYTFQGAAGSVVVAEVHARRLGSPLDSTLTLLDEQGAVIAFNDDFEDPASGLVTHHADSYLRCTLPVDGRYFIKLSDAQWQGGAPFTYSLRLSAPQPDFQLRAATSRLAMPSQGSAALDVHVIRPDGINVPVHFRLPPALTNDFSVTAAVLAGTQNVTRVTLTTRRESTPGPVPIVIEGATTYAGQPLVVPVTAAEDRMQAFFWRHLVPAQELRVLVYPRE